MGEGFVHLALIGAQGFAQRFGGVADSVDIHFPAGTPAGLARDVVTDIKRIPHTFAGFDTNW